MRGEGVLNINATSAAENASPGTEVAHGVTSLTTIFANVYFVGASGAPWILVDTGLPKFAGLIRRAALRRYGAGARPAGIILTHGHFDHAGSALDLATVWDVPIYAHPLELPYLTGKSDYPPQDPTMGGAIAFMSRFFPHEGYNFGARVRPLPEDGSVPGMPGWRWLHSPGHTPGHVSFFRDADRLLLAGDAVATTDMDSWAAQITWSREFDRPPAPFTADWQAVHRSVEQLAALRPRTVAAGHGRPLAGPRVAEELQRFAADFAPPRAGRYAGRPVQADENGLVSVPPRVPDPLPKRVAGAAVALLMGAALVARVNRGRG